MLVENEHFNYIPVNLTMSTVHVPTNVYDECKSVIFNQYSSLHSFVGNSCSAWELRAHFTGWVETLINLDKFATGQRETIVNPPLLKYFSNSHRIDWTGCYIFNDLLFL